jgi:hypothetical protein
MADPTTSRPPKPKLYKFVSVPSGTSGATIKVGGQTITGPGNSMVGIMKAMNSLGATVNSIAIITESIAKETSKTVATEIRQQSALVRRQEKLRKDKIKRDREKEDKRRKEAQRSRDADAEKKSEGLGKFFKSFTKLTTAAVGGFFSGIAKIFEAIFRGLVVYSVLDWISKPGNLGKLQSIIKGVIGIIKVFKRLIEFGLGNALDGIAKMIDGGISFKGLFGLFQFIIGSAVLFKTLSWIKNPAKLAQDFVSVVGFIIKGIMNLKKGVGVYGKVKKFMSSRAGKYVAAGATGIGAAAGSAILGGTKEEIVGTGIGAAGGALAGEMIGERLGGTAGAAAGAAAGSIVGGLMGGAVGKALKPVTDAIGKFFKLIGDILKPAFNFVGNIGKGFFSAIGDLIQSIVNLVEPHKEVLGTIAKVSLIAAFGPLIALMKAITWVIRLFVPKGGDVENGSANSPKRSYGGKVVVPQMASGGPLVGPTQDFIDPVSMRMRQALQDAMLLPFKAVGTGIISAFGLIGSVFMSFLPGPMQAFLGGVLAPIASIFGVPNSVFRKVTGLAMKGIKNTVSTITEGAGGLLEKLMGGEGDTSVTGILGKILRAVTDMHQANGQKPKMAIGGSLPGAANGGWISGPMSGYPVSLDGGRSVSFIGHGTEWVGFKGRAAGGGAGSAFVIPYHTPATVRTPSLTGMRMNQARAGGYAMPRSAGGSVYVNSIPKFANGGKFDPGKYNQGMKSSEHIVNPGGTGKSYVIGYTQNDTDITIKQINKLVKKGNILNPDMLTGVEPGSDEWKTVVGSSNTKEWFRSKTVPAIKSSKVTFKEDPDAKKYYYYMRAFKTTQDRWDKDPNISDKDRDIMAVAAAKQMAIVTKDQSALPGAKVKGAAPAELKDSVVGSTPETSQSSSASTLGDALVKAISDYNAAFGITGDKIDSQSSKTKEAQDEAAKAKLQQEASKVEQAAGKLQATPKQSAQASPPPTVLNSASKPSSDANPFLKSNFGLISQTAFDPSLVLF